MLLMIDLLIPTVAQGLLWAVMALGVYVTFRVLDIAETVEEVAMHSSKEASDKLKCTVLKNDTGLYVEALNESICVL